MSPHEDQVLFGKLNFTIQCGIFGGSGRGASQPFYTRAYPESHGHTSVAPVPDVRFTEGGFTVQMKLLRSSTKFSLNIYLSTDSFSVALSEDMLWFIPTLNSARTDKDLVFSSMTPILLLTQPSSRVVQSLLNSWTGFVHMQTGTLKSTDWKFLLI